MTAYTKNTPGGPVSGNFVVGDTVTDSVGVVWDCIVGGQPVLDAERPSFIGSRRSDAAMEAVPTAINTAGNVTYTAAQILTGIIVRDTNGGARSDTLPTAALLVAALTPGAQVGDILSCTIVGGGAAILTVLVGAGGAFDAFQLAAQQIVGVGQSKVMKIRLTNVTAAAEAYVVYM